MSYSNDYDLYQDLNLKKRRPLNILNNLISRELGTNSSSLYTSTLFTEYANRNETTKYNQMKRVYLTLTPNYSVLNVKVPNCFIRRFSPDGRYLIAFNYNLTGILIYQFNGCTAGMTETDKINMHCVSQKQPLPDRTDFNDFDSDQFRFKSFETFFHEKANLRLTENNETIHRECALFYKSSHLIAASSCIVSEENLPPYEQLASNNEAISYNTIENYTIYLIDVRSVRLCDKLKFNADKINLAHNQSLSLFNNVFAVLTQQNQTVHVYHILESNDMEATPDNDYFQTRESKKVLKFVHVQQIGRFCFADDLDYIHNLERSMKSSMESGISKLDRRSRINSSPSTRGFADPAFTGLKQRIVTFLYREAVETNTISQFYSNMNNIVKLKMYKMQLLDSNHLLIKYINVDHLNQKNSITITARPINPTATSNPSSNPTTMLSVAYASNVTSASNPVVTSSATDSANSAAASGILMNTMTQAIANANQPTPPPMTINPNAGEILTTIPVALNENNVPFYFVLYDMRNAVILNIFRNTSSHLLNVFENFQDFFSMSILDGLNINNGTSNAGTWFSSMASQFNFKTLSSSNSHANQTHKRNVKNLLRINSVNDTTKCLLSHLPISSQSYAASPYLDHSLFSYDEKFISNLERPKPIGDQVIKFNMRDSGRLCFKMYTGLQSNTNVPAYANKRLVAFIWHPREPFCISVQRGNMEYTVNFHIYSKSFF